jgi:signal transduction histidine kinase
VSVAVHVEGERIAARRNAERNRPPRESVETPQTQMPPTPPAAAPAATPGENVPTEARRPREGSEGGPRRFFAALFASARWQLFLAIYAVSVSVGSAWRLRQHAVERERKALELTASLSQAKLEALRLQLQPHFLFNTLNAIATLVHRDANAADEMITNLGDLLRLVLAATETEVPLRRELDLVDRYLAIERLRLGDRLKVEREIDPHVLDAAVPPLMLQTLIENAVRHGLEPRRAPGTITVRATRDGERLRLVVADDGVGLPPIDVKTERRGVGLVNTEARLHELHGAAARMVMLAPPEGGTRVEIELPCRRLAATAPKAVEA